MLLQQLRADIALQGRELLARGLATGTNGNISVRDPASGVVAITPSGVPYDELADLDVCLVNMDGSTVEGRWKPSSELAMHLGVYTARPELHAVVHTHSIYATTLSCLRLDLPALHYLVGFAGNSVSCADYATFGTQELADNAVEAMGADNAVLLANHGLLAAGRDLSSAMRVAEEVEFVARLYVHARSIGTPAILDEDEMNVIRHRFEHYGKQPGDTR